MSLLIYNLSIQFYRGLLSLISPFNSRARKWLKGREGLIASVEEEMNENENEPALAKATAGKNGPTLAPRLREAHDGARKASVGNRIWIHCASLGEYEQAVPVIEALKRDHPSCKIVCSFFSPSGYEIVKKKSLVDHVFYLPLDTRKNARRFIQTIRPSIAIFVKYEFWYHHTNELKNNNIPTFLISAVFHKKQLFFKWYGGLFRKLLNSFKELFIQDEESMVLVKKLGVRNARLCPDTRIDRVNQISKNVQPIRIIEEFVQDNFVLIGGSTYKEEEDMINLLIKKNTSQTKYIFAPHEIDENHVNEIIRNIPTSKQIYSEFEIENAAEFNAVVIDNIGMLSSLYQYAKVAFIGGGFGKNIHNILEPISFGVPVIFGPNFSKFAEANALIKQEGAFVVSSYEEFENTFIKLQTDQEFYEKTSQICRKYISDNLGGTELVMKSISKFV